MNIDVRYGLPFIEVTIRYRGEELKTTYISKGFL